MPSRPRRYAEGTTVPVEKTRADLEALLRKHGASSVAVGWDEKLGARILFRLADRFVQLSVPLPDPRTYRKPPQREAEERRLWRSRLLIVKAKLELIGGGETTVEREFLADLVLPNGATVGETAAPAIAAAYESGQMPRSLLPGLSLPALPAPRGDVVDGEVLDG